LGYKLENIELETEYDIGRPKVNKPRIDVVVRKNDGSAFLYIELKSPQDYEKDKDEIIEKQLFNLAAQEKGKGVDVKYLVLFTFELWLSCMNSFLILLFDLINLCWLKSLK
jgi:type I restriction enzyme M protein